MEKLIYCDSPFCRALKAAWGKNVWCDTNNNLFFQMAEYKQPSFESGGMQQGTYSPKGTE